MLSQLLLSEDNLQESKAITRRPCRILPALWAVVDSFVYHSSPVPAAANHWKETQEYTPSVYRKGSTKLHRALAATSPEVRLKLPAEAVATLTSSKTRLLASFWWFQRLPSLTVALAQPSSNNSITNSNDDDHAKKRDVVNTTDLIKLTNIRVLYIHASHFSSSSTTILSTAAMAGLFRNLQALVFFEDPQQQQFSSVEVLSKVLSHGKNIASLALIGCQDVDDSVLQNLASILVSSRRSEKGPSCSPSLLSLRIERNKKVCADGIVSFPNLENLSMSNMQRIDDNGLEKIAATLRSLKHLAIRKCSDITVKGIGAISQWLSLQSLDLHHSTVEDSDESSTGGLLLEFPCLTFLSLHGCRKLPNHALLASTCSNLQFPLLTSLDLTGCVLLTDEALQQCLSSLMHLVYLSLSGCANVTNNTVASIQSVRSLYCLDLSHCLKLTHTLFADVLRSRFSELRYLNMSDCDMRSVGVYATTIPANGVTQRGGDTKGGEYDQNDSVWFIDPVFFLEPFSRFFSWASPMGTAGSLLETASANIGIAATNSTKKRTDNEEEEQHQAEEERGSDNITTTTRSAGIGMAPRKIAALRLGINAAEFLLAAKSYDQRFSCARSRLDF